MVIINLNQGITGVTVDSTFVTVDSTQITVDNDNTNMGYIIKFIPRYFVDEVKLIFREKMTDQITTITTFMERIKGLGYCLFSFPIEDTTTFELTVLDASNDNLLFRGKAFATFDTDLQNYQMIRPTDNDVIIM
jgi:hypothetical protein